jgi:hypothetical protein
MKLAPLKIQCTPTYIPFKIQWCTNAHGMDLQQPASEKMYDTKAEYNEGNDDDNYKGYFHPQFPPSLVKEAETMMAVRRLPLRIGVRWKMQSRLKQRQQATEKVSKERSYDHKSIEYNAVETNPHSSDPPFGVLNILKWLIMLRLTLHTGT